MPAAEPRTPTAGTCSTRRAAAQPRAATPVTQPDGSAETLGARGEDCPLANLPPLQGSLRALLVNNWKTDVGCGRREAWGRILLGAVYGLCRHPRVPGAAPLSPLEGGKQSRGPTHA